MLALVSQREKHWLLKPIVAGSCLFLAQKKHKDCVYKIIKVQLFQRSVEVKGTRLGRVIEVK